MSFTDDYWRKKKELEEAQKEAELKAKGKANGDISSVEYDYYKARHGLGVDQEDLAPVYVPIGPTVTNKAPEKRTWFQKGLFEDGYDFGDVTKTILGTIGDVKENIGAGALSIVEGTIDTAAYIAGGVGGLFGADGFRDEMTNFIKKDLINEEEAAKGGNYIARKLLGEMDDLSVLGEKSDALIQSGGQLAGTIGLQAVGVPWFLTSGVTSFGSAAEGALNEGATYGEAGLSATISAGAEILTEKLFGGSGLGEKGLIPVDKLTTGISSKLFKALADYGIDVGAEGVEEVVSQFASNLSSALYKEEKVGDLLFNEDAIDGYIESFIGGSVLGGVMNVGKLNTSIKTWRDYRTELTDNEQKVVDREFNDRVSEAEKSGKKLTEKEKSKIHEEVIEDMVNGGIDIDKIEEVLGGDSYTAYRDSVKQYDDAVAEEKALREEYNDLMNLKNNELTGNQENRRAELKNLLDDTSKRDGLKTNRDTLGSKLAHEVFGIAKGDRLGNSYRGISEDFAPDYEKYKGTKYEDAARKTLESATKAVMSDGTKINNSYKNRTFIEMAAKISSETGAVFDFKSGDQIRNDFIKAQKAKIKSIESIPEDSRTAEQTEMLSELKEVLAKVQSGKVTVNGNNVGGNITINLNSAKAFNRTIGHEITHSVEKAKAYGDLQKAIIQYAKNNGDYARKLKEMQTYKGVYDGDVDSQIEREIVADLVGDYLFTDTDFIRNLSTNHRNIFQKVWDEIKYLCKVATAGSKEARQLERVRKAFEDAYRDSGKTEAQGDTKLSLSDSDGKPIDSARISTDEFDTQYSLSHNSEIEKGQSDFLLQKKSHITDDELREAHRVTSAMVDVMMRYSNILPEDKIGKVLTKNGSYDRSVENTTICVRTLAYNEFVDKVQEEIGRPLTQMESFLVSQKLYDIATEPQCLYCYVSLDRKAFNDMLLRYMTDRDTVIDKYNKSDKSPEAIAKLYEDFLHGRKPTKEMKDRFDAWLGYVDNGTQMLSLADIATEDSQSVIKANGGILAEQLADARKYAQSASWSKIQKNYVAYRDEILKLGDRVVKNLNEHYGMRWYSFSDYSAAFIVENMQQITDASIRGLKGLAYTKDTDFAEIFAPSGMNINVSVFVNQDADGNFFIDEKQSANFEKALKMREKYPNVGIVATVTNDDALRWAASQEWSDVIIPFHIVRTGTDVAEYYKWLNYTGESADTVIDKDMWNAYLDSLNLKSDNARKKVSKNIYPNEHKNDKTTYLTMCEQRGLLPRFARFAGEPWYMKLVNETRLSADASSPLKPVYSEEAAKASFQKFIKKGGYEGGWYRPGVDVDAEARIVADDVLAGKKANEVEYGRQDGFVPEDLIAKRKTNRTHARFSLSESVEETKDLIAMHNVRADKLMDAIRLGGLPSPSIAVTKSDIAHDNYGEITMIFRKESIDPQADKRNKVYGSDAWTPTISNARTEYEVNYDQMRAFEKRISELGRNAVGGAFYSDSVVRGLGIEDSTDDNAARIAERLAGQDAVRSAYLASIGHDVEPEYKAKVYSKFGNEALQAYIDRVGAEHLASVVEASYTGDMTAIRAEEETVRSIIREDYARKRADALNRKPELKEQRINRYMENNVTPFTIEDFVKSAWRLYEEGGGVSEEIDRMATSDKLRNAVSSSEVRAWLEPQIAEFLGEPGIYNGKDLFTPRGKRRSFAELHYPYTAENIVKAMQQASARGEGTQGASATSIIATATPNYKSIDAIRSDKDRLRVEDKEAYNKILSDIDDTINSIVRDIMRTSEHHADNTFDEEQIIGGIMTEAAAKPKTVASVQKVFAKEGYTISNEQAKRIVQLFKDASKVSTGYFEAKPERVVGFDEVAAVVIPSDSDVKLKQELLNNGFSIAEYDPKVDGDRQRVVNQFEQYKFSLSDAGATDQPYGRFNIYGKDIKIDERLNAPAPDVAPVQPAAPVSAPADEAEDMFPDDYAPVSEPAEADAPVRQPEQTVSERIAAKVDALRNEMVNDQHLREQSNADFDAEISRLQAEYDAKKNKNSIVANDILRRIERKKRIKATTDATYEKRISDIQERIQRMNTKEYRTAEQRRSKQDEYTELMKNLIGDTTTWVDKKLGISYKVNTLRRNLRDIVRDANGKQDIAKADAIYEELQGKYNQHEAELNREANRIKQPYAKMKITAAEDAYIQMLGEFRHNPSTTITEDQVKDFYEQHKGSIDTAKVDRIIADARMTYGTLLQRVNAVLREQGMKEIPYRQGYFPHFTDEKQGFLAKLFNWKTKNNDIPTSIAGLTEEFNPNRSWQSFNKQRMGDTTDYSFTRGMDTYVQGALDWVYHIEDIQKRRALENYIRYIHSEEGIKERIDEVRKNEMYDADEAQEQIDLILKEAGNPLGNFVQDLRAGTNTLANKKSSLDRGMEELTNRKIYSTMTNLSNRVTANMVAGSVSSALTNFIPITQSWGQVSPFSSLRAMADTIKSTVQDDGMIEKSAFLTNRLKPSENLHKTTWDKIGEGVGFMMEAVDSFTSQTVWRSKYLENISKGMSESAAIKDADQFAENVMAGRSRGNQPTMFDSKNPLAKILTAFQLEVNNQYGYMFKDMPQDIRNEKTGKTAKARLVKGYATMFLGAYAYNALYSSLTGRDAAFDPIGIVEELLRDMGLFGDDEEEEPTDIIMNLTDNILEEVPFVGGLLGGGRIPISSALPYGEGIYETLSGTMEDIADEDWAGLTKEWLNPLYYLAMPMGGGQIKKSIQGLGMFSDDHPVAGSYTDSGGLRFPVEDTLGNRIQAGIFGQWANKNAQDYIDHGRSPLNEKQIQEFVDVGMTIQDYWKYRDGLKGLKKQAEKVDYINGLDLTSKQKNVLKSYLFDEIGYAEENPEKYEFLENEGIGYLGYKQLDSDTQEAWSWAFNHQDKYNYLKQNGVYPEDYSVYRVPMLDFDDEDNEAYLWAFDNPEKATFGNVFGEGVKEYRKYMGELSAIESDKDANGNTISGSKKEKVIDYINNSDLDYGQRIILYRSMYSSKQDKADYNSDIIDYLNSRDDISYEEMVTILEELDMKVDENGYITW